MAGTSSISEKDLLCPQCSDYYCFPVFLKCGHNICQLCLHKFWKWKGCRECPVCGTASASGRPAINLALKIATDEYQAQRTSRTREVCLHHNEELKVFCNNDEEPICLLCRTSRQHKVHECCPVEEAARQKKGEISDILESLRKKLQILSKTKQQWEDTKSYIQTQRAQIEATIKEEFQKLHQFLWVEENARLKMLNREEETKTQVLCKKIEDIEGQIKTLGSTISDVQTALRAKDLPFLQDYKQTKKSANINIQDPEYVRDILINPAKHLGLLKFEIWRKMANIVNYAPIALDPNTAHYNLELSKELTCVQYSRKQLLPDNPERCTSSLCVLGAAGFRSGKHSWTVEVDQDRGWYIGVARESIKRKSTVIVSPDEGFWVIKLCNRGSFWAQTSPPTKLAMKQKPERITIELDLDKGRVAFINAADSTVMHTFKDKFTERIFPYFSPGLCESWKNSRPLTICPLTITVDVK